MKLYPDLWKVVFQKLPVKTLLRLRDVCKSWRTIIDSPAFITEHFQHFNDNSYKNRLLLVERIGRNERSKLVIRVVKPTFEEIAQITTVHGDCRVWDILNGLFLFQEYVDTITQTQYPLLRIYNPYVTKTLILPPCPMLDHLVNKFVLGFDPSTEDYKVIGFRIRKLSSEIVVYSCKNNCWKTKTVEMNDAIPFSGMQFQHHFCQGAAHWMMSDGARKDGVFEYTHVLSLDFRREEFRCVEFPERRMINFLFVLGQSLAVFGISAESSNIWILRVDVGERVPKKRWYLYDSKKSSLDAYNFFQQNDIGRVTYDEDSGKIFGLTLV
ncbi:putative F-box protein At3g17480 [Chenopodium quinoa]|uniref:putative F-box protein At3g17480 n=1 Tax=Chenopodium quinoa TaxID=63459 RepID=UPI000B77282C|nr:putative F-box protein At3g17480 [Chenopodium quinoa]